MGISLPLIWRTNVYLWWRTILAFVKHNWLSVCAWIHYYAGIKQFLVPVCVSKNGNTVPALEVISHTTVVVRGWNNGRLPAENWPNYQDNCPFPDIFSKEDFSLHCGSHLCSWCNWHYNIFVAGILTSQVGPLHAIMQTSTPGQLADQHVRSIIGLVWPWLAHFLKVFFFFILFFYPCGSVTHVMVITDAIIISQNTTLTLSMYWLPHHTCTVMYRNMINIWSVICMQHCSSSKSYTCHTKNILTTSNIYQQLDMCTAGRQ